MAESLIGYIQNEVKTACVESLVHCHGVNKRGGYIMIAKCPVIFVPVIQLVKDRALLPCQKNIVTISTV